MEPATKKQRVVPGPCIWWVRSDLRIQDNPALRAVNGAALCDKRNFAAVFVFDRRSLDFPSYGFSTTNFAGRKMKALHARFVLQSVIALQEELAANGSKLFVCAGKPEEVLAGLPCGCEVKCQRDDFSSADMHFAYSVELKLNENGSKLRTDFGATGLYHPHELPFGHHATARQQKPDWYSGLNGLCKVLGWKDISNSTERHDSATAVRPVVPAPSAFAPPPEALQLPGLVPAEVLANETQMLQHLGYTDVEIKEAQSYTIPQGGEPAARALLEQFAMKQNWAELAGDFVNYMIMGCISAREIFSNAAEMPNFIEVAQQLLWRDFHRLHNDTEDKGPMLGNLSGPEDITTLKEQIAAMGKQIEELRQERT